MEHAPQCSQHTPAHRMVVSAASQVMQGTGKGEDHTHIDARSGYQTENTPEYTQLYTGNPQVPNPTLSPVLPSPRQEELYCFERATLGATLPGTLPSHPTPFWHICKTHSSESRHPPSQASVAWS